MQKDYIHYLHDNDELLQATVKLTRNHTPKKQQSYKVPVLDVRHYKETKKIIDYTWRRELQRETWSERNA